MLRIACQQPKFSFQSDIACARPETGDGQKIWSECDDFLGFVDGFEKIDRVGKFADTQLAFQAQSFKSEAGNQDLHARALDAGNGRHERATLHAGLDGRVPENEGSRDDLAFGKGDDEVRKRLAAQLRAGTDAASGEHQQKV